MDTQQFPLGTRVLDRTRHPSIQQPWQHGFYVGTVVTPNSEVIPGAKVSEEAYCRRTGRIAVQYSFGTFCELPEDLIALTPEEVALSYRQKIKRFLGEEALNNYDRANMYQEKYQEEGVNGRAGVPDRLVR